MTAHLRTAIFTLNAIVLTSACSGPGQADMVLVGGRIWAGPQTAVDDPDEPTALAIAGGKVIAVGNDPEIEALAGPATQRLDLEARRVVPVFIDNDVHF